MFTDWKEFRKQTPVDWKPFISVTFFVFKIALLQRKKKEKNARLVLVLSVPYANGDVVSSMNLL